MAAIAVLGPLSVDGEANALAPRERAVLAVLVVRRGEAVSADVLADALWGEQPPASWAKMLQNCIVRLRKLLGPRAIETRHRGYCLVVPAGEIDACRFEGSVARAQELLTLGAPDRAAYLLDEAVRLWHGPPLADLDGWEAGAVEARRLTELRLDAEELRVDAHLRAGRFREVLAEAQARVAEAPMRERRWALLATAQYQAGRQADALRTVRRARRVLLEELGLDPGPDLADLEGAILRQDPSLVAATALPDASATCPYPGLPSYDVGDADTFFGRDADVSACLRRLADVGVLAVVGPSGSGKSSLVRAGVAAALERDGRRVVVVTPGTRPLDALAGLPTPGPRPVLVVDQCEEAVTLCRDAGEQERFFAALADHAAAAPLVVALRADRLGELSTHPDMARLVERGLHLLQRLGEDDLRAAIEGPARQAGLLLEPGLVDLLVRDVEGEPGALPLLSHSLRETWLRREGRTLTVAGYRDAGGIRGAVAQSAEQLYEQAPPERQALLRDLLLRLVAPSPEGEPVRARVPRRLVAGDPEHEQIVEQLVQARLVTSDEDAVELAHEALARAWPRLRGWLDDDVEGQRIWRHLALAADSWEAMGRPDSELYRGARLTRALDWVARAAPDLNPSERTFLDASRRVEDVRTRGARRRRRTVMVGLAAGMVVALTLATVAVTNQRRADREAGRAEVAAEDADRSARLARSRELAGAAINVLDTDPGLSKLLAVTAAAEAAPTVESTAALHQAWAADPVVGRSRAVHDAGAWTDLDPAGRRLVMAGSYPVNATNQTLAMVDPRTGEHLWTVQLDEPSAFVGTPFFTDGGERVVAGVFWDPYNIRRKPALQEVDAADEPVPQVLGAHVWDAETGELLERIELGRCGGLVTARSETHLLVRTLHGPPEVQRACRWEAGTMSAELLDVGTGERELLAADTRVDLSGAAMSGDGRYVAFDDAAAGTVTVREVASGDTVLEFTPTPGRERPGVRDLNRDGSLLLYGGDPIEVWDVAAGEVITTFDRQEGASRFARFDPTGRAVVSTDGGGSVRRWDAATGEELFALAAVGNGRPAMTADGLILASGIDSNVAVLVDTGVRGEAGAVETCDGHPHPDSLQIVGGLAAFHVTCGGDATGTTHVVDVASGELLRTLPGHQGRALGVAPDGTRLVRQEGEGAEPGPLVVRDLRSGEEQLALAGPHASSAERLRWSPDGSMIVAKSAAGAAVWDAASGDRLFDLPRDLVRVAVRDVLFTPDSAQLLVTTGDGRLRAVSTATWEVVDEAVYPIRAQYLGMLGYSPDGASLYTVDEYLNNTSGTLGWVDADTFANFRSKEEIHQGSVQAMALSPDGTRIATGASDGFVRVWDEETGDLVHEVPFGDTPVQGVAFVDDTHLAITPEGGNLLFVTIDPDELLDLVSSSLTRGFTETECERFNFGDDCPTLAELRGPAPDGDRDSALDGVYRREWTSDEVHAAFVDAGFSNEVASTFAGVLEGTHTLTFADGRYDLELIRRTCTGTYTTDGDRVSLSNERGVCGPGKLFDATFTITDGVLRFDDFYGIPEIGALTSQPMDKTE